MYIAPVLYCVACILYFILNIIICFKVNWTLSLCRFYALTEITLHGFGRLFIHIFVCLRARVPYYKYTNETAKISFLVGIIH